MSRFSVRLNTPPQKVFLLRRDHGAPASRASLFLGCVQYQIVRFSAFYGPSFFKKQRSDAEGRRARCPAASRRDNRDGVRFTRVSPVFSKSLRFTSPLGSSDRRRIYTAVNRDAGQHNQSRHSDTSALKLTLLRRERSSANASVTLGSREIVIWLRGGN